MSPELRAHLAARIADVAGPGGAEDVARAVARAVPAAPIDGDGVTLYLLDAEGGLWVADMDRAMPRAEREPSPGCVREVLLRATKHDPMLAELLPRADGTPVGAFARLAEDGEHVLRVFPDVDSSGGACSVAELYDARSGRRLKQLELREPHLRPERVQNACTSTLRGPDGRWALDLEAARRPLRFLRDDGGAAGTAGATGAAEERAAASARERAEDIAKGHAMGGAMGGALAHGHAEATRFVGELNAELSLLSQFVFFWLAGLLPLVPGVMVLVAADAFRLRAALIFAVALAVSAALVRVGLRPRVVDVDAAGVVRVRWGRRLAWTLLAVRAEELRDLRVERERRFAVSARGGGRSHLSQRPDRFRVLAAQGVRRVDLGSLATEAEAARVLAALEAWGATRVAPS